MYIARFEYVVENDLKRPGLQQIRDTFANYSDQPQQQRIFGVEGFTSKSVIVRGLRVAGWLGI